MPLHKSAEKRLRQSERRNARNRARKKELKTLIKNMQKLIEARADKSEVESAYRSAVQKLDRLGVKNYIHANKASRKKSQLTRLFNGYEAEAK
ncbi:30S ribosomal protein S20 [Chlorobium sp. N1]|uniref:30S ribosomal protein S20 n=1 Tax=Chlorobium sp. N1 TaxID=2491138 RepID=UPI00103B722A|nr:30S ribosomal protein S20 [Chlorobium sp. N1]TCD48889.1 30S ribosomal protein S20 [Chlorobium sp. N1]